MAQFDFAMQDVFGPHTGAARSDIKVEGFDGTAYADGDRSNHAKYWNAREQAVRETVIAHQMVQIQRNKVRARAPENARTRMRPPRRGGGIDLPRARHCARRAVPRRERRDAATSGSARDLPASLRSILPRCRCGVCAHGQRPPPRAHRGCVPLCRPPPLGATDDGRGARGPSRRRRS